MTEKNKPEKSKGPDTGGENFDDLEDAFFASGDASSFWETADADQLDADSEELAPDLNPLDEGGDPIKEVDSIPTVVAEPAEPEHGVVERLGEVRGDDARGEDADQHRHRVHMLS